MVLKKSQVISCVIKACEHQICHEGAFYSKITTNMNYLHQHEIDDVAIQVTTPDALTIIKITVANVEN